MNYNSTVNTLKSWVPFNKCSSSSKVIKPYPTTKSGSAASLEIWSGCADDVEIRLLTIAGKGHWYSMDEAVSVNTSVEIWNFVKNYSLDGLVNKPADSSKTTTPADSGKTVAPKDSSKVGIATALRLGVTSAETLFNVYNLAGKRLGFVEIIENDVPSMSNAMKKADYGKGVYILRSKKRSFMVPVDR